MRCGVPATHVKNVIIWGNHSSTQYPDVHHCVVNMSGSELTCFDAIKDEAWLKGEFIAVSFPPMIWSVEYIEHLCLKIFPWKCFVLLLLVLDQYYWQLYFYIPWLQTVQQRGAAVIKARKLSSAMSAAKAICDHMRDIWTGTPEVNATATFFLFQILYIYALRTSDIWMTKLVWWSMQ